MMMLSVRDGKSCPAVLCLGVFVAGVTVALFAMSAHGQIGEPTKVSSLRKVTTQFARIKRAQMQEIAQEKGIAVPAAFNELFDAITRDDWPAATNIWTSLRSRAGQYEGSRRDPAINTVLWQPVLETYGFYEQVDLWLGSDELSRYANSVLESLDAGSIYFGGTDPGRFVITAYREVYGWPDIFVITQNGLADNTYMEYLRYVYRDRLWLPSSEEVAETFKEYVADVEAGRRPRVSGVTVTDGRLNISGVQGVMQINGMLSQKIFDRNKARHAFYVEESYVIRWMLPQLEPHGFIMKLLPDRTMLTEEMIAADRAFWGQHYTALMDNTPGFRGNKAGRKAFSKLRCAIAGLYAHHGKLDAAADAFVQARKLYPASPEASFRYVQEVLMRRQEHAEARRVLTEFQRVAPENEAAGQLLDHIDQFVARTDRIEELESESRAGKLGIDRAFELADLYLRTGRMSSFDGVTSTIGKSTELSPQQLIGLAKLLDRARRHNTQMEIVLARALAALPEDAPSEATMEIVRMHISAKQYDSAARAMMHYLSLEPRKWKSWVDLAILGTLSDTGVDSEWALVNAIEVGGDDARAAIRKEKRLQHFLGSPDVAKALAGE